MRVVADTSVFIVLDRIGHLDVLPRLFGSVVRPRSVLDELLAGDVGHPPSAAVIESEWIRTEPDPPSAGMRLELGRGETAAILLAHETRATLIILDDLRARLTATGLGLRVTGTVGVLTAARREGFGPTGDEAVHLLDGAGFRLSPALARVLRGD